MQSLQIPSAFKFNFIFKVLPWAETLLITNSINVSLIKNDSPMQLNTFDVEYIASHHLPAQTHHNNFRTTLCNFFGDCKEIQSKSF